MAPALALALRSGALGERRQGGEVVALTTAPSLFRPPKLTPCNVWSPHEAGMIKQGKQGKPVPVQCNRPSGHSGNHMCLAGSFERLAEWGPAEVIK